MHASSGRVTSKVLYLHLFPSSSDILLAKKILRNFIPLSRLVLVWRILHNKMPTDNFYFMFGFSYPSACSFCLFVAEDVDHLFLHYAYVCGISDCVHLGFS